MHGIRERMNEQYKSKNVIGLPFAKSAPFAVQEWQFLFHALSLALICAQKMIALANGLIIYLGVF